MRVVPLSAARLDRRSGRGRSGRVLLGWLMVRMGAALPHLDAALTSYSLVASWWQARKHIANWWLWIVVDAVYIGEYLYKDLRATAVLYAGCALGARARCLRHLRDWQSSASQAGLTRYTPLCTDIVEAARRCHVAAQFSRAAVSQQRGAQIAGSNRHVRRDQQIRTAPQRMPFRQRLGIGHVECGANSAGMQRLNQRVRIHNRPARGVHQQRALPHQRKLRPIDQPASPRSKAKSEP